MTIAAKKFTEICDEFPIFRSFLIVRGLQRRAFMKAKQKEIVVKLGLESAQTRFKEIAKDNMNRLVNERPDLLKATDKETIKRSKSALKNTRASRNEHLDFEIEDLLVRKCHFHLSTIEVPTNTSSMYLASNGKSYTMFLIPGTRQYLNSVTVVMSKTRHLLTQNMVIFK